MNPLAVRALESENVPLALPTAGRSAVKAGRPKGNKNFSAMQDLLIAKAFINASEDSVNGTAQRVDRFKEKIGLSYKAVVQEQLRLDAQRYQDASRVENQVNFEHGIATSAAVERDSPYPDRPGESIYRRFTTFIHPTVSKFLGLEKQNPIRSGEDKDAYFVRIALVYKARFNTEFNSRYCLDYLRDKSKYSEYCSSTELKAAAAKERPLGKTAESNKQRDSATVEKMAQAHAAKIIDTGSTEKSELVKGMNMFLSMTSDYMNNQSLDEEGKKQRAANLRMKLELEGLDMQLELQRKKRKLHGSSSVATASAATMQPPVRSIGSSALYDDDDSSVSS